MEEAAPTVPEYQPLRVYGTLLCDHARQTIPSCPICLLLKITTVTQSWFSQSSDKSSFIKNFYKVVVLKCQAELGVGGIDKYHITVFKIEILRYNQIPTKWLHGFMLNNN